MHTRWIMKVPPVQLSRNDISASFHNRYCMCIVSNPPSPGARACSLCVWVTPGWVSGGAGAGVPRAAVRLLRRVQTHRHPRRLPPGESPRPQRQPPRSRPGGQLWSAGRVGRDLFMGETCLLGKSLRWRCDEALASSGREPWDFTTEG